MQPERDVAIASLVDAAREAAVRGGRLLFEHWQEFLAKGYAFKGPVDLVTEGDRRSEAAIVELLRARFPDHDVLTEEGGALGRGAEYRWLVDPLDGTTNYAHGLPVFAVSVAVERQGELLAAAVYQPEPGYLYLAGKGAGASRNGRALRVSPVESLDRSLLATGFPYNVRETDENNIDHFDHFSRVAQGIRRLGAAALDLCWVAEGWLDGFWEVRLHPWDVAAGMLIVQEAGGHVTDLFGRPIDLRQLETVDIVATNGRVHRGMLEVLQKGRTGMGGARDTELP